MKLKRILAVSTVTLGAVLSGCAGYGNAPDSSLGSALSEMHERQDANPGRMVEAGAMPMDGVIAERVMKTYRADTGDRGAVKNTIQVNIGN